MSDQFSYAGLFPYPSIRDEQTTAIDFALDAFVNQGKRFVILEMGTGGGKSGVGIALARYLNGNPGALKALPPEGFDDYEKGAYFLTTQKILQDQYVRDFGHPAGWMKTVKSSTNYQCKFKKQSCAESQQLLKGEPKSSPFYRACTFSCVYKTARTNFLASTESVTNFPYFLTSANYAKLIRPRSFLVIDEAHNIESELSKFIDVSISENFAKRVLKIRMPVLRTQFQAVKWIKESYYPRVQKHLAHVMSMMDKFKGLRDKISQIASLSRQIELLNGHHTKISKFLSVYDKDNWVMNSVSSFGKKGRRIEFKVIDISPFAEDSLFKFGQNILLMSATILNKDAFCESLGISRSDAAFLSVPSPFPVKNRPILYAPVGRMSRASIDQTLPKLADTIKTILEHHTGEKGIIHTHTFRIANYLRDRLSDSRILTHDSANREDILEKHLSSDQPTVLISPSMTEGVDLKGDTSRFQIICKIPYPYLGDPLCKKRMNKWGWWYGLQTAKTIMQAAGRSVRSIDDYAVTYILDEDWSRFYGRNSNMFSKTFKDALQ